MSLRQLTRKLGPVGLLGVVWTAVPALLGLYLVARLGLIADVLKANTPLSGPVWTLLMAVVIGIGLLPVYSNTLLCGWVFGWVGGFVSALTSYLAAATISYLLARRFGFGRVDEVIEGHDGARRVRHALVHSNRRRTLVIISLWRLAAAPFPLSNLLMASCGVPLGLYLRGTLFGLGPRVIIGTLMSSTAARTGAHDIQALVRDSQHPVLLLLGVLASVLILGMIGQIAATTLRKVTDER